MCDYGDPPEFWSQQKIQSARKKHACCECQSDIDPGEQYYKCCSVLDGKATTHKFCMFCWDKRIEYADELDECAIGSMWDAINE